MIERTVHANGVDLHVYDAGDEGGFPVILVHGFPELGYSWRHQLPALAAAGYRVLAPDMRGYGRSSSPSDIGAYDIEHLTGDLIGLLDDLGAAKAIFVGHDWGSIVTWSMARLVPERMAGVVGMSVPFVPRGERPPTEAMRFLFGDAFFYMLYFQEPGVADADLGRDAATTMRRMLCGARMGDDAIDPSAFANDGRGFVDRLPEPTELPAWLSQAELDHYVAEFTRTGFTGGINWYRNLDCNWELTEHVDGAKVELPSLFVAGTRDPVLMMMPPAVAEGWLSDHRGDVLIDDAGHWVQQEAAAAVNDALLTFCREVAG